MTNNFNAQDGTFLSYQGREEAVTVPEGIHTIAEDAFKACISLKKIVLPRSLRRIMPRAFKGCRNLNELEIPEGVSYVGEYAFHRCHSLKTICLPASVEELGNCAFLYCDSLREVHIPGVRRLGSQAFLNDTLLEKITISRELDEGCIRDVFTSCGRISNIAFADGTSYAVPDLVGAAYTDTLPSVIRKIAADVLTMFELDGSCLMRFLTNLRHVEIPEGITHIGKSCFFDRRGILSVTLPSSLKEIESRAFRNCISLEKVTFRTEQTEIHKDAFKNCTSLKQLILPNGREFCLQGLAPLSGQEIPPLVQTVRSQVLGNFRLCGSVLLKYLGNESRVIVPDGITSVAEEAFAGKESIDRIVLPESVRGIGDGAFRGCLLLQTIQLPSSLQRIGKGAFENCVKLLRVSLPDSITKLENMTFRRCRSLAEVKLPSNLREIGEQAFYACSSLRGIAFPDTLTSIGTMSFYRCAALKSVFLPESIQRIGCLAFAQSGTREAVISGDGKEFGNDLFADCAGLTSLVCGTGVRHLPDKLAFGCPALTEVTLPDSLESVGRDVFRKTPFLRRWVEELQQTFLAQDDGTCKNACSGSPSPAAKNRIFWDGSGLSGEVRLSGQTQIIAGGAFYGNTNVTSIMLPDTVRQIGTAAFKGCSSLTQITWPHGLCTAEAEIFSGCTALAGIENAPAWHQIHKRAFYNCQNLTHLNLRSVKYIGAEAFVQCSIRISPVGNADFIGENAFMETSFTTLPENSEPLFPDLLSADPYIEVPPFHPNPRIIGSIAVAGNEAFGELTIPEGTTGIAPYAFFRNKGLKKLYLPQSLRFIGEGAFIGCQNLEEVIFLDNGCRIGARAFEKCTKLKEVSLCGTCLAKAVFAHCTSLQTAFFSAVPVLGESLFEGCTALREFSSDHDHPVTQINASCFRGCRQLNRIDLSGVQTIAPYAFENCDALETITVSGNIFLDDHAFQDCGGLTQIQILGDAAALSLREYALSGCTALKYITAENCIWELSCYHDIFHAPFPETVRMIFSSALSCFDIEAMTTLCGYHGCGRSIKIPQGIRRIEAEVFYDFLMLEDIHIPESVEYIGPRAFHKTAWLEKQRCCSPVVTVNHMLVDASTCTGEVTVSEDTRLICGWAFANGLQITKIHFLPSSLKVEPFAFRNCIYLEEITLPGGETIRLHGISDRRRELPPLAKQVIADRLNCFKTDSEGVLVECTGNISKLLVADGVTAIGAHAFQDSNLLTELILPESVTEIRTAALMNCKWLKTVRASAVETIGDMAFSACGVLETVELSEGFTKIGARAFEHCTSLREILLPEGIEEIPERAFFRCHSLGHIHIPSTVKYIGREAFAFCEQLSVTSVPADAAVGERAFFGTKVKEPETM